MTAVSPILSQRQSAAFKICSTTYTYLSKFQSEDESDHGLVAFVFRQQGRKDIDSVFLCSHTPVCSPSVEGQEAAVGPLWPDSSSRAQSRALRVSMVKLLRWWRVSVLSWPVDCSYDHVTSWSLTQQTPRRTVILAEVEEHLSCWPSCIFSNCLVFCSQVLPGYLFAFFSFTLKDN